MAKELTAKEAEEIQRLQRFVGTPDEFEFIGDETEVQVIEIEE